MYLYVIFIIIISIIIMVKPNEELVDVCYMSVIILIIIKHVFYILKYKKVGIRMYRCMCNRKKNVKKYFPAIVFKLHIACLHIQDITWWGEDTDFIFK